MTKNKYVTLSTSIGSALEYYDFVIFMMMSSYIIEVFFPNASPLMSKIETLSIFAVAYLMRPIGGILFGHLGDKYGRKSCFLYSIILMAAATIAIGLLPGYKVLGSISPILLCIFRMIQGIAQGGELPGALTFMSEHSTKQNRGWKMGLIIMSVGIGSMFSMFISYLLLSRYTHAQMVIYGWRIPFLIGGIVGVLGCYIRKSMVESPLFLKQNTVVKIPLVELLYNYPKEIIKGIFITLFAACFIIFSLFLPNYLHEYFGYETKAVMKSLTWGIALSSLLIPCLASLTNQLTRRKIVLSTTVFLVFTLYFLFQLLVIGNAIALYAFVFLYQTIIAVLSSSYPPMLAELFPTNVRYSGVAFCYNTSFSIAGLIPVVTTMMLHLTQWPFSVVVLFIGLASLTALAAWSTYEPSTL